MSLVIISKHFCSVNTVLKNVRPFSQESVNLNSPFVSLRTRPATTINLDLVLILAGLRRFLKSVYLTSVYETFKIN